ncbi:MAG: hypothetical protein K6E47_04790 [Lachnospiraceae bacterium]|nr:hypothetical protein [Lachnospiraceae bacterium]
MDSILEALELAVTAIVFCIAVYFFLTLYGKVKTYSEETLRIGNGVECSSYSEY